MPVTVTRLAIGAGLVTALAAGLALYGTDRGGASPCAPSKAALARVAAASRGEVAAMEAPETPRPAPDIAFKGPDGTEMRLTDLRGKLLLVNLWATWCAPCKAEMPALDRLQAAMGGPDFQVVAINLDTRNVEKPPLWMSENGIGNLAYYADPGGRVLPAIQRDTGSTGLPTTMLIDEAGCTIGVMKGPAEWSGAEARKLIQAALGRP